MKKYFNKNTTAYIMFALISCWVTINLVFPLTFIFLFISFGATHIITNSFGKTFLSGLIGILSAIPILLLMN